MSKFPITLSRFIIEQQAAHPEATGEFSILLDQIGLVGKMISRMTLTVTFFPTRV